MARVRVRVCVGDFGGRLMHQGASATRAHQPALAWVVAEHKRHRKLQRRAAHITGHPKGTVKPRMHASLPTLKPLPFPLAYVHNLLPTHPLPAWAVPCVTYPHCLLHKQDQTSPAKKKKKRIARRPPQRRRRPRRPRKERTPSAAAAPESKNGRSIRRQLGRRRQRRLGSGRRRTHPRRRPPAPAGRRPASKSLHVRRDGRGRKAQDTAIAGIF